MLNGVNFTVYVQKTSLVLFQSFQELFCQVQLYWMAKEFFNWLEKDVGEAVLYSHMLFIRQVFHLDRIGKREEVYIMTHTVAGEISLKR